MKKRKLFKSSGVLLAIVLVLVTAFTSVFIGGCSIGDNNNIGTGSTNQAAVNGKLETSADGLAGVESETGTDDGNNIGIKVHGHWTIDVLNANGSSASHTEFDNGLTDNGKWLLYSVMRGNDSQINKWAIKLNGPGCFLDGNPVDFAYIIDTTATNVTAADNRFQTLSLDSTLDNTEPYWSIILQGTAVVAADGSIVSVATSPYYSQQSDGYITGWGPMGVDFTATTLASPVTVQAGQTVMVKVSISFS